MDTKLGNSGTGELGELGELGNWGADNGKRDLPFRRITYYGDVYQ